MFTSLHTIVHRLLQVLKLTKSYYGDNREDSLFSLFEICLHMCILMNSLRTFTKPESFFALGEVQTKLSEEDYNTVK